MWWYTVSVSFETDKLNIISNTSHAKTAHHQYAITCLKYTKMTEQDL